METLGALVDRLSIVNLKLWHCQELLEQEEGKSEEEITSLATKNRSLLGQRRDLIEEVDAWMAQAVKDPEGMHLMNPQNKIYGRFRKEG